jgi:hypothetical protein
MAYFAAGSRGNPWCPSIEQRRGAPKQISTKRTIVIERCVEDNNTLDICDGFHTRIA